MLKLIANVTVLLFSGLMLFVLLGHYNSLGAARYLPLVIAICCAIWLAVMRARSFSYGGLFVVSMGSASIIAVLLEVVGVFWLPGLAKHDDVSLHVLACLGVAISIAFMLFAGFAAGKYLLGYCRKCK